MRFLRGSTAAALLLVAGAIWVLERGVVAMTRHNASSPKGAHLLVNPIGAGFLALTGLAKSPADRWLRPRYPRLWRKARRVLAKQKLGKKKKS